MMCAVGNRVCSVVRRTAAMSLLLILLSGWGAFAQGKPTLDTGDTAWVLMSTALVMFMTPGLALFYAGMVRTKNVLGTIMHSFVMLGIVGVTWVLFGYSLSFGGSGKYIGDLAWFGLKGVGIVPNADYAATIPASTFMIFQGMFAIITPALMSGAIAERMKFGAYCLLMFLWSAIVYTPIAHWVWGKGGFLGATGIGALDFAGGTVVHISSGIAALACCIMLGKRRGLGSEELAPHNVTMTVMGASILWFGWFGFNAGSALGANGIASNAFVTTNTAAAAATLSWLLCERMFAQKPTALGAASGCVAGLVAITPGAGFVTPLSAVFIGFIVSFLSYGAIQMKGKLGYDDSLDVVGVHFVGGTWGALATGLFCTSEANSLVKFQGLFLGGGFTQLIKQIIAIGITAVFSFAVTMILLVIIKALVGLRVNVEDETIGLDLSQHGELGYNLEAGH